MALSAEPVYVVPYDPFWPAIFEAERARLEAVMGRWVAGIEHVGSTAVPGLDAKPVVDIMAGVRSLGDADRCVRTLEEIGYEHRGEAEVPGRIFFRTASPRACHLHLVVVGGEFWESHLLFRDYLRTQPETASEYARLKHELAPRFRHDREAYTEAKTGFAEAVVKRAKASPRLWSA